MWLKLRHYGWDYRYQLVGPYPKDWKTYRNTPCTMTSDSRAAEPHFSLRSFLSCMVMFGPLYSSCSGRNSLRRYKSPTQGARSPTIHSAFLGFKQCRRESAMTLLNKRDHPSIVHPQPTYTPQQTSPQPQCSPNPSERNAHHHGKPTSTPHHPQA